MSEISEEAKLAAVRIIDYLGAEPDDVLEIASKAQSAIDKATAPKDARIAELTSCLRAFANMDEITHCDCQQSDCECCVFNVQRLNAINLLSKLSKEGE